MLIVLLGSPPDVDEDVHRAAADHAFFTGFVGSQRKVMQRGTAVTHRLASFGPYFGFHATTAHRAGGLAAFEKEHLRAAALWSRATCQRNCRDHDALAAP